MTSTTCAVCHAVIPRGRRGRCPKHPTTTARLHHARRWADLSRLIRAGGVCALCGARGVPLEADHIVPVADDPGRAYELSNLRALCRRCHRERRSGR